MQGLHRKKQSDVMRDLLRVPVGQYRQMTKFRRAPGRPAQTRLFISATSPSGAIQTSACVCVAVTAIARSARNRIASPRRRTDSYWVVQYVAYKYYEVLVVNTALNAIRRDAKAN